MKIGVVEGKKNTLKASTSIGKNIPDIKKAGITTIVSSVM